MSQFRTLRRLVFLTIFAVPLAFGLNAAEPVLPLLRLEELKTGFESFVSKNVTIPYFQGIKALNAKVKPALERESTMAATRKDLDALARIKADIERIDKGLLLTDADSPPPDFLKYLYAAYKLELAKVETSKTQSLAEAKHRYDKGLMQIQDELTTAQQAEAALHVRNLREGLISEEGSQKGADKVNAMSSAQQQEVGANKIKTVRSKLNPADYFSGKFHKDLDAALKEAKTTNKPVWVIGYGDDEEKHLRHWRIFWFMELKETKRLVDENFIQVMAPFSDKGIQPLIATDDNLELPMLFLLSPQGRIIFKRVLNENSEWGLLRTKEYILKTQTAPEK